ncbi:MAG: chromosome segregation protein SMC [Elusimicrobia bacterium]|nr:chromosome segregation protein SMC [Elusimicrobiota bacterium]
MYLKSIELSGFKSFAEPTEILLQPGITAIVGPNGCGKSNTVDAIRWCLGELSPKMLRSKSTLDVIFNGTRRLSQAAHTQVTLTFDNFDRALHLDAAEVSVSRKAYRDGASEYSINKSPCRLKDIKGLFAGTGLGDDGYSIMEGSMVEFLLSAKPAERRLLFDEASGAARFGGRRDEALSRLNRIDQDLNRVRDNIELIVEEKKRIESQARKARLHERLTIRHRELQIQKIVRDWGALKSKEEAIRADRLAGPRHELESRLAERDQRYAESETIKARLFELAKDVELSGQKYHEALRARDITTERLRHLESKLEERRQGLEDIEKESRMALERAASCEQELALIEPVLDVQDAQCRECRSQAESAEIEGDLSSRLHERRELLTSQIQLVKARMADESQELAAARNKFLLSTSETARLQAELKAVLKEHHRVDAEKIVWEQACAEALDSKEKIAQEITFADSDLDNANLRQQELLERRRTLEEALYRDLTATRAGIKARIEQWERQSGQDPYVRGAGAVLEAFDESAGITGPIGRHIRCQERHAHFIKDMLGERLNWFVADNMECALTVLKKLETQGRGRAVFVLRDRIEAYTGESADSAISTIGPSGNSLGDLGHLLGQTPEPWRKIILFLMGPCFAQGESVFGHVFIRGGETLKQASRGAGLGALDERDELLRSLKVLDSREAALESDLKEAAREIQDNALRRDDAAGCVQNKKIERSRLHQELELRERDLKNAQVVTASLQDDAQRYLAEIASKRESSAEIEGLIRHHEESLEALQKEFESLNGEFENALLILNNKREMQFTAEMKLEKAIQSLQAMESRKRELQDALARHREQAQNFDSAREHSRLENARLTQQVESGKSETTALGAACAEEGRILEHVKKAHETAFVKSQATEAQLSDLESAIEGLQETIRSAEADLRGLEFERLRVAEEGGRVFGVSQNEAPAKIAEAVVSKLVIKESETLDSVLERVTGQLSRLGQINFLAQEEFDRLGERITFLETQQEDILKAKADIQAAIARVNAQIEEAFGATFAAVREKFREIFSRLFVGGEADLVLTEATDAAPGGVEIFAQPPGKKLQSIALLSQGEKALTAVSLLFAFFSINPAPVCILDEVDAPLDENNVVRFTKMLKQFSEKCQFVVITHNKRTMESAHTLYGVTMEELGVSKLISVKLADVAAAAV